MGNHSTKVSLKLFDFLIELGNRLDYFVDMEYPMSETVFGSQAIDIAWFNEEKSQFPLFIFEIESSTNNSIANNPTKVFGKESKVFEKPLFFFHIIIDSAENSEKYNDLLGLFGKYNYDIFKLNSGEIKTLLIKILLQHRRIYNEFDLFRILTHIIQEKEICSQIDIEAFLTKVEEIVHENQSYRIGQVYADIASCDDLFLDQYSKFLHRSFKKEFLMYLSYEGYSESITSEFINLGILYNSFGEELSEIDFKKLLIEAQKTETFSKIEYLPGLNRDYDIFIHDHVSFYLALSFMLFQGNLEAQKFILDIVNGILDKLPQSKYYIIEHHVSWGLLISATSNEFLDSYERIKNQINANGDIYDTILYSPIYRNEHNELPDSKLIQVPDMNEYCRAISINFNHLKKGKGIQEIAVMSLSNYWKEGLEVNYNLGIELANYIVKSIKIKENAA